MSDFVERCRREWRRLGIPAAVVDDVASELEADIEAAAADGVSVHELLGGDPRAFAASWAEERGVVPSQRRFGLPARSRLLVAAAALLSVAALAAGTALLASPTERSSALPLPLLDSSGQPARIWIAPASGKVLAQGVQGPDTVGDSRQTVAWSLVIAGLVAFGLTALLRWRTGAQVRRSTS